jgi:hypothetical protein
MIPGTVVSRWEDTSSHHLKLLSQYGKQCQFLAALVQQDDQEQSFIIRTLQQ